MKIILLGLKYLDDALDEYKKINRNSLQMAPHNFQKHLINGLKATGECSLDVISVPPMGSFPRSCKSLWIKKRKDGCEQQVGYLNLPVVKKRIIESGVVRSASSLVSEQEDTWLLLYSLYEPFVRAAMRLKKRFPNLKICLLQTDCAPGRGDMPQFMTPRYVRYGDWAIAQAKGFDAFVLLTKYLAETLEVGNRPYMVMEGLVPEEIDLEREVSAMKNVNERPVFLYAGSLGKVYSMDTLVEAFLLTDKAELWLCGDGDYREELLRIIEKNPGQNIKYLGFLSQQELAKIREKSSFLINPRKPSGTYTKYSFPSKTMEYMLSGIPTVMCRLEGIPEEYDAYLNYMPVGDAETVKAYIEYLIAQDNTEICEKAKQGRRFVAEQKNAFVQSRRIVRFLSEHGSKELPNPGDF